MKAVLCAFLLIMLCPPVDDSPKVHVDADKCGTLPVKISGIKCHRPYAMLLFNICDLDL